MNKDDRGVLLLWVAVLLLFGGAIVYGVVLATAVALKIAAAVISAAALLMGAIVNHSLAMLKEQELERQRQMQQNYVALVGKIGIYLRETKATADELDSIHLLSWIYGTPQVIMATQEFMASRTSTLLRKLLVAMRKDVGLPEPPPEITVENVFGAVEPRGALNKD